MAESRTNSRLEAFSDGVFAIALTLLIIDVKLPNPEAITSSAELWRALGHLGPTIFAFLLSFGIILITWVNHHAALELMNRTSTSFVYANGLLLLTVVAIPFPTSLLGEFVLTDHAAPAVVVYNGILVFQAIAWLLLSGAALKNGLTRDARAAGMMAESKRNSYFAMVFYGALAVIALWFPLASAIVTTASWLFWLTLAIKMRRG